LIDPATETFLGMLRASGGKPFHQLSVAEARDAVLGLSRAVGGAAEDLHQVVDRTLPVSGGDIGIRLYWPRAAAAGESLPIVMHYHGGGFVAGSIETHDVIARYYARHADALVVSVDYRLAPEHKFPTALEDSYAALRWAVDHAGELGADPTRVAVTGDSAGGTISAGLCLLARERGGPAIAYQALVYPAVDFDPAAVYPSRQQFGGGGYLLSNDDMRWFTSLYLTNPGDARDPRFAPFRTTDLSGLPPALVLTAGCDLLRDEGKAYADRLATAGVPVEYRCFEGTIHAFMSFSGAIPAAVEGLAFVSSRMRAALHRA
jgi:acetyl esterase